MKLQVVVPFAFCYDVPIVLGTISMSELYGPIPGIAEASPSDYEEHPYDDAAAPAATLLAGETSVNVYVKIYGDAEVEADELFTIWISVNAETYLYNPFANIWIEDYDPSAPAQAEPIDWVSGLAPQAPPAPAQLFLGTPNWPDTEKVYFGWQASPGATSYNVKRKGANDAAFTTLASGVAVPLYDDYAVSYGTSYCYVVSAVNAGGESADSPMLCATPAPPLGCSGAPGDTNLLSLGVDGMTPAYDGGSTYEIPNVEWFRLRAKPCFQGWIQLGGNTFDPSSSSTAAEAFYQLATDGLQISPWSLQPYPLDPTKSALRVRVYRSWSNYSTIWLVVNDALPKPKKLEGLVAFSASGLSPSFTQAVDQYTANNTGDIVTLTATLADPQNTLLYVNSQPVTSGVTTNLWAPDGSVLTVRVYKKSSWALIGERFISVQ